MFSLINSLNLFMPFPTTIRAPTSATGASIAIEFALSRASLDAPVTKPSSIIDDEGKRLSSPICFIVFDSDGDDDDSQFTDEM